MTEASNKQTVRQRNRHNSSVTFVNGETLKKNLPSACFFWLPPISIQGISRVDRKDINVTYMLDYNL